MFCNNCGISITEPNNFCLVCGADISNKIIIYDKAPLLDRFIAKLLDLFFEFLLSVPSIIFFVIGILKRMRHHNSLYIAQWYFFIAIIFYIIPITYSLIKDGLGQGQSWGKKSMGLMVVHLEFNMPCSKWRSFFRNLVSKLISIFPIVGWLIEPILVIASTSGRKLGDHASETMVILSSNYQNI